MADKKFKGFRTVETNDEELNEKIRQHRKKILRRVIEVLALVVIVFIIFKLIYAVQKYDDYEVKSSIERDSTNITKFEEFSKYILEYSNDGVLCMTKNGTLIWNQAFEMVSPMIETCGEYLVVYDQGGTQIYIVSEEGLQKKIETTSAIQTVALAQQGTIAVLMKENDESRIKLFDKKGNELANGKFYDNKGSIPVDIALSKNATKMAVSMVDVTGKAVSSTITFYNFGTVGQSEIDNNVGTYSFDGTLIPEIKFVSDNRMIALGTDKILVFEGSQKPEVDREIKLTERVQSFFCNEKYIGIVYDKRDSENAWHIEVMDLRGKVITKFDTQIAYEKIEFLSNNEICITSKTECEIYTRLSTKKFSYTFDKEIYSIIANGKGQNYIFIFKETAEEVRLK
jgi:hypothetical protein